MSYKAMSPMSISTEISKQLMESMTDSWFGHKRETQAVRPHLKVFWLSKEDSTGHNERKKRRKGRQKRSGWGGTLLGQLGI